MNPFWATLQVLELEKLPIDQRLARCRHLAKEYVSEPTAPLREFEAGLMPSASPIGGAINRMSFRALLSRNRRICYLLMGHPSFLTGVPRMNNRAFFS
jgi:hypothetical protein